jgi:hypothetical protein
MDVRGAQDNNDLARHVALCIGVALAVRGDARLQKLLRGLSERERQVLIREIVAAVQPQIEELLRNV